MVTQVASLSRERSGAILSDLFAISCFAALTAVGAQIAVRLPFSPVPLTLQVLTVVVSGMVLGSKRGWTSQMAYLAAGAAGLPVFAGGVGGLPVLVGPTAGYLLAFPAGAFVAGALRERLSGAAWWAGCVAACAAVAVIYAGGALWLLGWLGAVGGVSPSTSLAQVWTVGVKPFLLADFAKAVVATATMGGMRNILAWICSGVGDSGWRC